jgi:predicted nucleic acid-binding protein
LIPRAVVDSSVAIRWVVEEEDSDHARAVSHATLEAPDLLLIECANILWKKVTVADLNPREAGERWQLLLQAPVQFTASPDLLDTALRISLDLKHPVYDCVYLALALQLEVPLITADRRLVTAVRRKKGLGIHVAALGDTRTITGVDTA